jgi:hypothetical protein
VNAQPTKHFALEKLTDAQIAKYLNESWRLTDAQMAKYILSQRFVDGRWVSPIVLEGHGKNGPAIDAYVET